MRRIGKIQEMSLIFRIGISDIHRIIRKLGNPLKTCRTESAYHGRIHIRIHDICRIELIYHPRFLIESFHFIGKGNIIAVYIGKEISLLCLSGYQSDGIPLISSSLNGSFVISLYYISVVAYIIEYRFAVSCFIDRFQHPVDIGFYLFLRTGMTRFIIDFEPNNGGIVFIS